MVPRQAEAVEQTQAMCRRWYQEELVERDQELLDRSRHQELMDKERYQELSSHFNQGRANNAELRKTLAERNKKNPRSRGQY
eukprot:4312830-Prorocentrum_lima.AAC.1